MKLTYMPYAQAHVTRTINDSYVLTSYETEVAKVTREGWLEINGLYSMTTRRHIMAFVKEYAPAVTNFQTVKFLATNGLRFNIHTGEIA